MLHITGNKEKFALEVDTNENNKAKLRLWISGIPLGSFKKRHVLSYALAFFDKLTGSEEDFYDNNFDNKSAAEIINTAIVRKEIWELDDSDLEIMKRYLPYGVFLGDQFDDTTCIYYVKNKTVHFIWHTANDFSVISVKPFDQVSTASVLLGDIKTVFNEFKEVVSTL